MSRPRLHAIATILFVEVFSFAYCIRGLGFYQDDWALLEHVYTGTGFSFWHGLKTLWSAGVVARPTSVFLYSALCALGGLSPLPYQVALLAANALAAIACFLWLERLTGDRRLALLAAVLGAVYPIHPATHHWMTNILQPLAHALAFAALTVHVSWSKGRAWRPGLACGALFATAFLTKETVAFLPLLALVSSYERLRTEEVSPQAAVRRLPADIAPLLAGFAVGILWQWVIKRAEQPLSLRWSIGWTATVYGSGLDSLTRQCFQLLRRTIGFFFASADDASLLLLALSAVVAAFLLSRAQAAGDPNRRRGPRLALLLAGANFVAAYAPYAASGAYEPQVVGMMSRTNEVGAWTAALLLAAGLCWLEARVLERADAWPRLPARALLPAAAGLILAAFTATNWFIARQWAASWTLQQDILARVARRAPQLPPKATLLVTGVPLLVNGTAVFHESNHGDWPFAAAFRLKTGRADVKTALPTGRLTAGPDGIIERDGERLVRTYPYDGLYLFELESDKLTRIVR